MKNFNDIKNQWETRNVPSTPETGIENIIEKSAYILKKQRTNQIVLGITILILVLFFFYISAYKNTQAFWGLGIMIGSLAIRIILEYISMLRKGKLPVYKDMKAFNKKIMAYYHIRKRIHFLITPLLFATYIAGFVWLLPLFKANLSPGFYTYILWSSVFIFVGLAIFIGVQIRKELFILKQLKNDE